MLMELNTQNPPAEPGRAWCPGAYMKKRTFVAEMAFLKILIKSLNLAENPYKIPKFGGKTNYIQKIGGDIISRNSTFFMYATYLTYLSHERE